MFLPPHNQCISIFFLREFFYPKGNIARTKVENFLAILNLGKEDGFFKRFSIQLTSVQLDALLMVMESAVNIPSTIPKAVSVVSRNTTQKGDKEIWALNKDLFIDASRKIVHAKDEGVCWIGHLVKDPGNNTAREERSALVHLPLTSQNFDFMCHFLRGSVTDAVQEDKKLEEILGSVLSGYNGCKLVFRKWRK